MFRGEPEPVTIPEDEEPSEEEAAVQEAESQEEDKRLDAMSYEEMLASIYNIAGEAKKSIATVSRTSGGED